MSHCPCPDDILLFGPDGWKPQGIYVLQANICRACNMACKHCHVEAGPDKNEMMDRRTMDALLKALGANGIPTLDITGGAPELNPHFRHLVSTARQLGSHVIVRSNLTVFSEPGMEDLPLFFRDHTVEVTASLPCYTESGVDSIRGAGAFVKCVNALRTLNSLGYGSDPALALNLVHNPAGAVLPPPQAVLEREFRLELREKHGITFNQLFVFNNMPIGRFGNFLDRTGEYGQYCNRIKSAFNPAAVGQLMCRNMVSVRWDGAIFDCDFNLAFGLRNGCLAHGAIHEFDMRKLLERTIKTGDHCFVCAAGQGST